MRGKIKLYRSKPCVTSSNPLSPYDSIGLYLHAPRTALVQGLVQQQLPEALGGGRQH